MADAPERIKVDYRDQSPFFAIEPWKCQNGDALHWPEYILLDLHAAEIAALRAERDAAVARVGDMRKLIMDLRPSHVSGPCWCDRSHDLDRYGHEPKCIRARALSTPTEGTAT